MLYSVRVVRTPCGWMEGCGASLSIHLNPSLFVRAGWFTRGSSLSPSQSAAHTHTLSLLLFTLFFSFCLLWIPTGVSAFAVHPKTREHIQTEQQRHGQRQSEREDDGGRPHQRDRPGQPGPEAHKRRCCQGESNLENVHFGALRLGYMCHHNCTIPVAKFHLTSAQWSRLTIIVNSNKLWETVKSRSCQTAVLCASEAHGSTFAHCVQVPAVFPLTDFPLLGKGFAEVLKLIEAIHWKAIHMRKYLHKQQT